MFKKIIFSLFITIFILGCTTTKFEKIIVNDFKGFSEALSDEKITIMWNFDNCNNVRINSLKRNFNCVDSIEFIVSESTILDFVVSNHIDTINLKWRVILRDNDKKIKTGPDRKIDLNKPNYFETNYFNSLIAISLNPSISKLKIVNYDYDYDESTLNLNFLLLDDFGNLVTNIIEDNITHIGVEAINFCQDKEIGKTKSKLTEIKYDTNKKVDLGIMLDNSIIAGDFYPIMDNIKHFAGYINSSDRYFFKSFNQYSLSNIPLKNLNSFRKEIVKLKLEKASGLSSIYKNLYDNLNYLYSNRNENTKQSIVLIVFSSDNSSLVYDRNDIVQLSMKYKIPIFVVGVGSSVDTYSMKYLCEMTGGKFYELEANQINDIVDILTEINLSQKVYYSAKAKLTLDEIKTCNLIKTKLTYWDGKHNLEDSISLRTKLQTEYFKYQSIASFEYKETVINQQYIETINSLAKILNNNKDKIVELIGNTSIEGNYDETYQLGLKRAQEIRNELIKLDVNPNQIRVRSDGANNPVYYFQEANWMQYYNRRVELRWLDPESMPYELITETFESEYLALQNVENWEKKGYKSYYERYLKNNIPIYRVKLWGFKTIEEAQKTKTNLEKRFPLKIEIQ